MKCSSGGVSTTLWPFECPMFAAFVAFHFFLVNFASSQPRRRSTSRHGHDKKSFPRNITHRTWNPFVKHAFGFCNSRPNRGHWYIQVLSGSAGMWCGHIELYLPVAHQPQLQRRLLCPLQSAKQLEAERLNRTIRPSTHPIQPFGHSSIYAATAMAIPSWKALVSVGLNEPKESNCRCTWRKYINC